MYYTNIGTTFEPRGEAQKACCSRLPADKSLYAAVDYQLSLSLVSAIWFGILGKVESLHDLKMEWDNVARYSVPDKGDQPKFKGRLSPT